jgi:hypothetical protein
MDCTEAIPLILKISAGPNRPSGSMNPTAVNRYEFEFHSDSTTTRFYVIEAKPPLPFSKGRGEAFG